MSRFCFSAFLPLLVAAGISDVLFGVFILSIATMIREKVIAVISGFSGHMEIMVANVVESNIFLQILCMGILWTATDAVLNQGSVKSSRDKRHARLTCADGIDSLVRRSVDTPG